MKTSSETLISDLIERSRLVINQCEQLKNQPAEVLNKRPHPSSWSALECIEHLSLYGDFYIPNFEKAIKESTHPSVEIFKSGWLGDYSAKSMMPKEKLNKMKTFKDKNPLGFSLDHSHIDRFIDQQKKMLAILDGARKVDLNKTKCSTTLKGIRFNLGDTLRFVIYHNERHVLQALRALKIPDSRFQTPEVGH